MDLPCKNRLVPVLISKARRVHPEAYSFVTDLAIIVASCAMEAFSNVRCIRLQRYWAMTGTFNLTFPLAGLPSRF